MITPDMIPDDVVEAAAMALSEAELWPGVWSRLDSVVQDAFTAQARAAIAAALNAWPEAKRVKEYFTHDTDHYEPAIILPLPQENVQNAER